MAEWYGAGLATARSRAWIPPVAAVYQRQLSVPSLWGRLMSTSKSWGSKRAYHAMHYPRIRGLAASAGVWLRANKWRSALPHGLKAWGKDFTFLSYIYTSSFFLSVIDICSYRMSALLRTVIVTPWLISDPSVCLSVTTVVERYEFLVM